MGTGNKKANNSLKSVMGHKFQCFTKMYGSMPTTERKDVHL